MLIPLVSVSLIGLVIGLLGLTRRAPAAVLVRCLLMAWTGYAIGAVLGVMVEALVIGGFWIGLVGHVGAGIAASRTARLSTPAGQRSLSA